MNPSDRHERGREDLRKEILNAARDMFATGSFEEFSMRKLASKIGYSATTIYLYFTDRRDLLNRVCQETFAELNHTLEQLLATASSPLNCIRAGLRAYVEFAVAHPNHYKVVFLLDRPNNPDYRLDPTQDPGSRIYFLLRRLLSDGIDSGEIRPLELDATAQSIWASIHGLATLLILETEFPLEQRDRLIETQTDLLINGLAAQNASK